MSEYGSKELKSLFTTLLDVTIVKSGKIVPGLMVDVLHTQQYFPMVTGRSMSGIVPSFR